MRCKHQMTAYDWSMYAHLQRKMNANASCLNLLVVEIYILAKHNMNMCALY